MSTPTTPTSSTSPSPSPSADSLFTRLVWTPLIAISFIISLVVTDWSVDRAVHASSSPSKRSESREESGNATEKEKQKRRAEEEARYYRYKKRKLAKFELGRAIEMRRTVVVLLLIGMTISIWFLGYAGMRAWDIGIKWWNGEEISLNFYEVQFREMLTRFGWE